MDLQRSIGNAAVQTILASDSQQEDISQLLGTPPRPNAVEPSVQRQPKAARKLDAKAAAIIAIAAQKTKSMAKRAVEVVKAIIDTYFASQRALVAKVVYDQSEPGLSVTTPSSKKARGKIHVGDYFVQNTTRRHLARRVLQVDHEIEHVRQHRQGLGGRRRKHLREFLAFHREALAPEVERTGRVSHSTRVALIDGSLKHYYKLSASERKRYATKRDRLLARRSKHSAKSGRQHPPPPNGP